MLFHIKETSIGHYCMLIVQHNAVYCLLSYSQQTKLVITVQLVITVFYIAYCLTVSKQNFAWIMIIDISGITMMW